MQGAAGEALTATRRAALPPEPLAASLPVGVVKQLQREGENHGDEYWPDKLRSPGNDHLRADLRAQDLADPHRQPGGEANVSPRKE